MWGDRRRSGRCCLLPRLNLNGVTFLMMVASAFFSLSAHFMVPLLTVFPSKYVGVSLADESLVFGVHGSVASAVSIVISPAVDRLPAFGLALLANGASAVLLLALPLLPRLSVVATLVDLAVMLPIAETVFTLAMTLARKRLVDALFVGSPAELARDRLRSLTYVLYGVANFADVASNMAYLGLLHSPRLIAEPRDATIVVAYLAGALLAVNSVVLWRARLDSDTADHPPMLDAAEAHASYAATVWRLLRLPSLWRFTGMCSALTGVLMIFRYFDLLLTQWIIRIYGERSFYPLLQSINPAVVGVLTVAMPAALRRLPAALARDSYLIIALGTVLSAAAPLLMGGLLVAGLDPYLVTTLGMLLFSLGEAVWSPCFLQYSLSVAPVGQEAVFTALAVVPRVLVRLPSSLINNWLLDTYCPRADACAAGLMWLIVGAVAAATPLVLLLGARWLREPGLEKDSGGDAAAAAPLTASGTQ